MKRLAVRLFGLLAIGSASVSLGGCEYLNGLTQAQKVALTSQVVNGLCVLTAAGLQVAQIDNSILNPNASSGGSGQSAAGTITKASALTVANCTALNGVLVTLSQGAAGSTAPVTALAGQ